MSIVGPITFFFGAESNQLSDYEVDHQTISRPSLPPLHCSEVPIPPYPVIHDNYMPIFTPQETFIPAPSGGEMSQLQIQTGD